MGELSKRLNSKSMEIRQNIYIKGVDNKGYLIESLTESVTESVSESMCRRVRLVFWRCTGSRLHTKGTKNVRVDTLSRKAKLQSNKKLLGAILQKDKNGLIRYNYSKLAAIIEGLK